MSTPKPSEDVNGDIYTYRWPDGTCMELDRLHDGSEDFSAEVLVSTSAPPSPGVLSAGRINLASPQTRNSLAKSLKERIEDTDWPGYLLQVFLLARARFREGEPPINLLDVDPYAKPRWLLRPYLECDGPTILYADGGSGKSLLALWMALQLCLAGKKCMYLDYETSPEIHTERWLALGAGMRIEKAAMPPILYRHMQSALTNTITTVKRDIGKYQIDALVLDSIGAAGNGAPEDAATAVELFQALRALNRPTLAVHHKRKSNGMKGSERERLFGSVYYVNLARLVWEMESVSDEQSDVTRCSLINVKCNNGRPEKRHGLELHFVNENDRMASVTVSPFDPASEPEFAERTTLRDRILHELRSGGGATAEVLTSTLGAKPDQVRARLNDLRKLSQVIKLHDGRWGILSDKEEIPF